MSHDLLLPLLIGAVVAAGLLWASLRLRRRQRLLRDLPTSRAQGVFIGLVELHGTAESPHALQSFLAAKPCVHYEWQIEEHWTRLVTETHTGKDGRSRTRTRQESGWSTVAKGGDTTTFFLRDETGAVRINPAGAKIENAVFFDEVIGRAHPLYYGKGPPQAVAGSTHRRRCRERGLLLHAPLYVVGTARERTDLVAPEVAHAKGAELFLISARGEAKVQTGYAIGSWCCWALGLIAAVAGAMIASDTVAGSTTQTAFGFGLGGAGGYLLAWGLGWLWMAYNSLVGLRQRVRQGWSLIDVQLKRRHDLIPPLVSSLGSLRTHEHDVQTALAALRTQAMATGPGEPGPDLEGVAFALRAVAERYPQLTADAGFTTLQRELVETEQRIALARSYYNDIATHFATRLEQIPDRWAAALQGMQREPLFQADRFERAPVAVDFAL